MNKIILVLIALTFNFVAQADMMKVATLDITCVDNENSANVVSIVANEQGSAVTVDGQVYPGSPLIGGTEGGDPYLQAVNNAGGYNITVTGGDFQMAFYEGKEITNGTAKAYVNLFNKNINYEATCTGTYSFN